MSRTRAFGWILLCYAVALVVGVGAWLATPQLDPFVRVAVADVAATLAVFVFSRIFDNSSFYDAYWSVAPMVMAPALALTAGAAGVPGRVAVVLALVQLWGVRLTLNWARGWGGLDHEDWRYVHFRRTTGRAYWLVSLAGIHLFPTAQVLLGCLALQPALIAGGRPLGWLDAVALLVTGGAITLEAVADVQLRAFRRSQPPAGAILQTGLWARMRHPNYTGELGFWWGLWLFGVAAVPGAWWWTLAGPVAMTLMFAFVSIPLIDRRHVARRPAYAAHMKAVPSLVPLPGRVARGD
jgi:steroid 5-alpha reductase family enzyme